MSFSGRDIRSKERRSRCHSVAATSITRKEGRDVIQWSRHQLQGKKVATSFSGRDIRYKERRSRRHSVVATSVTRKEGHDVIQWLQHQLQGKKVTMSFSGRNINYKERRSQHYPAVATSDPRDAKGKSRPNKSFYDVAETTKVTTKNRGRDINNQMGQLI